MKYITYFAEKEITKSFQDDVLEIRLKKKEIKRIIKIDSFLNLNDLCFEKNKISKLEGLDNLVNLHNLSFNDNQIEKIEGLDNLVNLHNLSFNDNQIEKIEGLDNLVNLHYLSLNDNQIDKIEGLTFLVNLHELDLSKNNITKIEGLELLTNLQSLHLSSNKIKKIEGIELLINLQILELNYNKITKIEGLESLVNLHILSLSRNKINKIEKLENLVNLNELHMAVNKITKIEGLYCLINLHYLVLSVNLITKIEGLDRLVNLKSLEILINKITEINDPSQITSCINLIEFEYDHNIIVHPVIIRFLNHNKLKNNKLNIFNDSQNVHNNSINCNIIESVNRLLKDVPLINVDQTELISARQGVLTYDTLVGELINDPLLTEQTKELLLEYMSHTEEHSMLLLSFAELFGIVWQVIQKHPDSSTIKEILNQEMNDSICKCFTGRMNRLVNVLNGFDERIIIKIAESDAIANVIIMLKKKYTNLIELKEVVHKELIERGYDEIVIKDWIDFIE